MKNVTAEEGFLVFQKFFTDLLRLEAEVVVWQVSEIDGRRTIHRTVLTSFKYEQGRLHLQNKEGKDFDFNDDVLFCWAEKDGVIFKTKQLEKDNSGISLQLPEKLCFLEGPELTVIKGATVLKTDIGLWKVKRLGDERSGHDQELLEKGLEAMTSDDEEKLYADKREAPRVRAKGERRIKVCVEGDEDTALDHVLYDLSRGGLAFVVEVEDHFKKGDTIHVLEIEKAPLDSPLIGEVMSVRALDNDEGFKIGIKFVEEI